MMPDLPLLDLFNCLRDEYGWPLGIDEYIALLQALRKGVGCQDREALTRLCCLLWAKSPHEARLLSDLFGQILAVHSVPVVEETLPIESGHKETEPKRTKGSKGTSSQGPVPYRPSQAQNTAEGIDDPIRVAQAVRRNKYLDVEMSRLHSMPSTEYFPVTRRQMKQSWRYLRRPVREGAPEELDIHATVEKISREGVFLEPVLVPRRVNRAELVLLIDQDGSMVPFHILTRQLLETSRRGGRLGRAGAYYFHDYPGDFLYRDPARVEAVPLDEALDKLNKRSAILIVSDGGAARGSFDEIRVKRTEEFITRLQQSVRYCVWLNPMPRTRWLNTSAGDIAQFIPMFEMDRHGLDVAIDVLRGRYASRQKI